MSGPSVLVLHHTASPASWRREDVLRAHKARGFRDVGYHELVCYSTEGGAHIEGGRPYDLDDEWEPWEMGAHVRGHNADSWAAALVGNYDVEEPPEELLQAAAVLFASRCLQWQLDPFQAIRGHRELAATACPGRFVDLGAFRRRVASLINPPPRS